MPIDRIEVMKRELLQKIVELKTTGKSSKFGEYLGRQGFAALLDSCLKETRPLGKKQCSFVWRIAAIFRGSSPEIDALLEAKESLLENRAMVQELILIEKKLTKALKSIVSQSGASIFQIRYNPQEFLITDTQLLDKLATKGIQSLDSQSARSLLARLLNLYPFSKNVNEDRQVALFSEDKKVKDQTLKDATKAYQAAAEKCFDQILKNKDLSALGPNDLQSFFHFHDAKKLLQNFNGVGEIKVDNFTVSSIGRALSIVKRPARHSIIAKKDVEAFLATARIVLNAKTNDEIPRSAVKIKSGLEEFKKAKAVEPLRCRIDFKKARYAAIKNMVDVASRESADQAALEWKDQIGKKDSAPSSYTDYKNGVELGGHNGLAIDTGNPQDEENLEISDADYRKNSGYNAGKQSLIKDLGEHGGEYFEAHESVYSQRVRDNLPNSFPAYVMFNGKEYLGHTEEFPIAQVVSMRSIEDGSNTLAVVSKSSIPKYSTTKFQDNKNILFPKGAMKARSELKKEGNQFYYGLTDASFSNDLQLDMYMKGIVYQDRQRESDKENADKKTNLSPKDVDKYELTFNKLHRAYVQEYYNEVKAVDSSLESWDTLSRHRSLISTMKELKNRAGNNEELLSSFKEANTELKSICKDSITYAKTEMEENKKDIKKNKEKRKSIGFFKFSKKRENKEKKKGLKAEKNRLRNKLYGLNTTIKSLQLQTISYEERVMGCVFYFDESISKLGKEKKGLRAFDVFGRRAKNKKINAFKSGRKAAIRSLVKVGRGMKGGISNTLSLDARIVSLETKKKNASGLFFLFKKIKYSIDIKGLKKEKIKAEDQAYVGSMKEKYGKQENKFYRLLTGDIFMDIPDEGKMDQSGVHDQLDQSDQALTQASSVGSQGAILRGMGFSGGDTQDNHVSRSPRKPTNQPESKENNPVNDESKIKNQGESTKPDLKNNSSTSYTKT